MKFCLSARLSYNYIKEADEVRFEFRDRGNIPNFIEKFPDKKIILQYHEDDLLENAEVLDEILLYRDLSKDNLVLAANRAENYLTAKNNNIKAFLDIRICTFDMLQSVIKTEPEYIILGAPLFFKLDKIKEITQIPIRAIPNVASDSIFEYDGVSGTWIRPENIDDYDQYIDVIEFDSCSYSNQETLFRIYNHSKEWNGELQDIIKGIDIEGNNGLIDPNLTKRRIKCGQICVENKPCSICHTALKLARAGRLKEYQSSF